ncbi:MAG: HEAT repeat domain-containing protein [Candidatus Binatia bacterium]
MTARVKKSRAGRPSRNATDRHYRSSYGPMNINYVAALVLLCLVVVAVYFSLRKTANGNRVSEPQSAPVPVKSADEPSQPRNTASGSGVSDKEFEERRAAARIETIEAMEKFSDVTTLTTLGNALTDPNREVKDAALQALSERKGAAVTAMIGQGLADADPEFRIEVLEVLAIRGDRESLRRARSDPHEEVRERAADLLESAGK